MDFKIGDKVLVRTFDKNKSEDCVVVRMGFSSNIMFVRKVNGDKIAIFKCLASKIKPKNQQLVFNFME